MALDGEQFRELLRQAMAKSVADQAAHRNWNYRAVRPQVVAIKYNGQTMVCDCSDGVRILCYTVGIVDDPAGNGYATYGNSSSIWAHLTHIPLSEAKPGDIITFGYYAGEHHAAMIYDMGDPTDPLIWNMGGQGQPIFDRLSTEIAFHRGMTVTVCRLNLPPDLPPTPQEKLQAQTDFYAWMSWIEGWNDWKHYGPKNPKVRPNVPKLISPAWWARRAQFLLNRKKADKATSGKK